MKRSSFINMFLAVFMLTAAPVMAQEEHGFKKFNVVEGFEDNGFQWFRDAQLLAAGNKEKSNAMTIGWGAVGTLWQRPALTVYVAEKRYTKEKWDSVLYRGDNGDRVQNHVCRTLRPQRIQERCFQKYV